MKLREIQTSSPSCSEKKLSLVSNASKKRMLQRPKWRCSKKITIYLSRTVTIWKMISKERKDWPNLLKLHWEVLKIIWTSRRRRIKIKIRRLRKCIYSSKMRNMKSPNTRQSMMKCSNQFQVWMQESKSLNSINCTCWISLSHTAIVEIWATLSKPRN